MGFKNRTKLYVIIVFLLVLVISIWFFLPAPKPPVVQWASYLIRSHLTSSKDSAAINSALDTLLQKTPNTGKVRINHTYDPAAINVYIIDGNDARVINDVQVSPMISNCEYIGNRVVLLDDAYLRGFMERHHVDAGMPKFIIDRDQSSFLYWVIGHELGHLACGHLGTNFEATSLDRFVSNSTLQNEEELQADSFFVHALAPHKQRRISEETMMLDILNAEIEGKVGKIQTAGVGLIYDYTNRQIVSYAQQPTHPEFVIRLSRMLELSSKASADSGLQNLVGGFIKQLKQQPPAK